MQSIFHLNAYSIIYWMRCKLEWHTSVMKGLRYLSWGWPTTQCAYLLRVQPSTLPPPPIPIHTSVMRGLRYLSWGWPTTQCAYLLRVQPSTLPPPHPHTYLSHEGFEVFVVRLTYDPVCISTQGPAGDGAHQSLLVWQTRDQIWNELSKMWNHAVHTTCKKQHKNIT